LQVKVHATGFQVGFGGTLAGVDDFKERLQGFAWLTLFLVSHALAEFAVFEFGRAIGGVGITVATNEGESAGEAEKREG
jgi:hypothetical protein